MQAVLAIFLTATLIAPPPAIAATLTATRPGLICVSAKALAQLTLNDGSSRALSPNARRGDGIIKQEGGCADFGPGQRVTLLRARRNTSIVSTDLQNGQGPQTFLVPNIDFQPDAPAEANPRIQVGDSTRRLSAALGKTCPQQGWSDIKLARSEHDPIEHVFYAMTRGEQRVAQDEAETNCAGQGSVPCVNETVFGVMIRAGHLQDMVRAACTQKASGR